MYEVVTSLCLGCGACVQACPQGAIALADGRAAITAERCLGCGACAEACPQGAIRRVEPAALPVAASLPEVKTEPVAVKDRRGLPAAPRASSYQGVRLAPLLGSALLWVGREVVPNLLAAWRRPPLLAERQALGLRRMHRQRWRGR